MCLTRLILNQQNAGIVESELPYSYEHEFDDEFIQEEFEDHENQDEEEQILFVGISIHQFQLGDGHTPLTVLGLCTSVNNDCPSKRYKESPTPPSPSAMASLFEVGLQGAYEAYHHIITPDHIIIYRNITEELELVALQAEDGEIHQIKSIIQEFYEEKTIKFSYVAVVSNYSGIGSENVEIVPNGSFTLDSSPPHQQQPQQQAQNITTCLTLATSSPEYDLNKLVQLTTDICEYNGVGGTKPNILKTTTRFTNTMGRALRFRILQQRRAEAEAEAEQRNNN